MAAPLAAVSTIPTPAIRQEAPDDATGTLGALLYADEGKERIPEAEWVALVQSIAASDQLALRALYERTHRIVFTLIMRITHNRQSAEELTLDVFHDVWKRASQYDAGGGTVLGWIMNQARSRAIDRLRFERRKKRGGGSQADALLPTAAFAEADDIVDFGERSRILQHALTTLTPDERAVIEAAFFSELTYAEVAVRLGQPIGTVKTRIRSGLGKLRQALGKADER